MIFLKIKRERILENDLNAFKDFFKEVNSIYMNKNEILPLESLNMQIRSGINTIQGFCELILVETKNKGAISIQDITTYIEMMLDSCKDIMDALIKPICD
jgi:hypothetical protein